MTIAPIKRTDQQEIFAGFGNGLGKAA